MPANTYLREDRKSYISENGERIPSHRYRAIRDGMKAEPAQELRNDPEVIRALDLLDELERRTHHGRVGHLPLLGS